MCSYFNFMTNYFFCNEKECMSIMQILVSFAQILFGASASVIAFQQWKLGKNNAKFSLYEKRYEAYKELKRFLGTIIQNAKVETQDLISFRWKFEEHFFLFGDEVHMYIKLVYKKALEFGTYDRKIEKAPAGEGRNQMIEEQGIILEWLISQNEQSKKKFEVYLRIK